MNFYVNDLPPVYYLDAAEAFEALSEKEKEYVYACSQACWIGGLIDLLQTSPESAGIFLLAQKIFKVQTPENVAEHAKQSGFSDSEIEAVLSYFACVFGNLGNYQHFGDTKFVPSVSQNRFLEFVSATTAYKDETTGVRDLTNVLLPVIYSLHPRRLKLGFGPSDGISTYYSADCTQADAEAAQAYLKAAKLEGYNTRLFREPSNSDKRLFCLRFASAECHTVEPQNLKDVPLGWILRLVYGDWSELMKLVVESSLEANARALNSEEAVMWNLYAESFRTGNIDRHKEGSKAWIKDKNPAVETYIGFIESYRDPLGVRGEFEGFVAVVNKVVSAKFQKLVDNAEAILAELPWPHSYERDRFTKPDFTSLDVLTFASSGIPIGINIPNYDEIRETFGFKNVSLGNVLSARFKDPKTDFLSDADRPIFLDNIFTAFEVQVGLHELLGHGSGKLFRRNSDGTFNFDPSTTLDIVTGKPIGRWYEPGENWDNTFANLSSAMEECRAECVGMYLCDLPIVLHLFETHSQNIENDSVHDITYVNWLGMVRSGVTAMEFYTPPQNAGDSGVWRQAHCCARYVILRILLDADPDMVHVDTITGSDGAPDLLITFDKGKLKTVAKPAIGEFLLKLQYYKSTGNAVEGRAFFSKYSELTSEHLSIRKIVIDRKRPRPVFVQPHFRRCESGTTDLISYPPTYIGLIQSFIDRFSSFPLGERALIALENEWRKDQLYFKDVTV